jgi:hypothetical protein
MKIKYKVNKRYPNVQYIAQMESVPMAQVITDDMIPTPPPKINKQRVEGGRGITVEEERELNISVLSLCFFLLRGLNLKDIIRKLKKDDYPFDIILQAKEMIK